MEDLAVINSQDSVELNNLQFSLVVVCAFAAPANNRRSVLRIFTRKVIDELNLSRNSV